MRCASSHNGAAGRRTGDGGGRGVEVDGYSGEMCDNGEVQTCADGRANADEDREGDVGSCWTEMHEMRGAGDVDSAGD